MTTAVFLRLLECRMIINSKSVLPQSSAQTTASSNPVTHGMCWGERVGTIELLLHPPPHFLKVTSLFWNNSRLTEKL